MQTAEFMIFIASCKCPFSGQCDFIKISKVASHRRYYDGRSNSSLRVVASTVVEHTAWRCPVTYLIARPAGQFRTRRLMAPFVRTLSLFSATTHRIEHLTTSRRRSVLPRCWKIFSRRDAFCVRRF